MRWVQSCTNSGAVHTSTVHNSMVGTPSGGTLNLVVKHKQSDRQLHRETRQMWEKKEEKKETLKPGIEAGA